MSTCHSKEMAGLCWSWGESVSVTQPARDCHLVPRLPASRRPSVCLEKQPCSWAVSPLLICQFVDIECFPTNLHQLMIHSEQNKQKKLLLICKN